MKFYLLLTIVDAAHSSNEGNSHKTIGRKTTSVSKGLWNKSSVSRWSLRIPNGNTCKILLLIILFLTLLLYNTASIYQQKIYRGKKIY